MRKILIATILLGGLRPCFAGVLQYNTAQSCLYSDIFWYWWGARHVVLCGYHPSNKCDGYHGASDQQTKLLNGQSWSFDGTTYWCCNGTKDEAGRISTGTEFKIIEEITVTLPAGKCMYKKITDICGNVISDEPCTTATFDCEDGFALAGTTSPKCIECPETNTQGIQETDNGKTCIKCASNKFFDKDSQTCKDKEWLQQNKIAITKDTMAKCFQCPGTDIYKKCVLMFDAPDHLSTGVDKDRIKTQCKL